MLLLSIKKLTSCGRRWSCPCGVGLGGGRWCGRGMHHYHPGGLWRGAVVVVVAVVRNVVVVVMMSVVNGVGASTCYHRLVVLLMCLCLQADHTAHVKVTLTAV